MFLPGTSIGTAGADQQTPDISAVIQEIVDRTGWSSGNSLVIIITGSGARVAGSAPLLVVDYTEALGTLTSDSAPLTFGSDEPANADYFNGIIDEVRVSASARSADWIATSYNNQSSPATFYSLGIEQVGDWNSYSDSGHDTPSDYFDDYATEHIVYMYGTGFAASTQYRVVFWDGNGTKVQTEDSTTDVSGNLSAAHEFAAGSDTAGNWHSTVYDSTAYSPSSYDPDNNHIVADDTSYTSGYAFYVAEVAIPEFPTIIAGVAVAGMCFGIYYWMRKRRQAYVHTQT